MQLLSRGIVILGIVAACGGGKSEEKAPRQPLPPPPPEVVVPTPPPPKAKPKAIEAPALLATPLPGDPLKTTIHRLSNGMTVYISPDSEEPSIVAHVAVRAGSRNDPEISTGLAHYLEHMLFKGTRKLGTLDYAQEKPHLDKIRDLYADLRKPNADRPTILAAIDSETQKSAEFSVPNELDKLYAQLGITGLNAFTDHDATVYVSEIPKNRVAQWARVEAARYSDAVFRLFWPELEAVYEEKNRSLDSPPRRVNEAFLRALYPKHGYGWSSTLGEIDHLKSPAYGDMEAFFARYYTPQNMAILLAGDVDESVLPQLEAEFGQFKRPAGDAMDSGVVTELTGRTQVDVPVPAGEGVQLGWELVSATHPDRIPLEVMDLLLLDGQSGIMSRELILTQKVARATCSPSFLREGGYYTMTADALNGQSLDELEKLLLGLVTKVQNGDFTDSDVATAILTSEIQLQRQQESNSGRMGLMEEAFIVGQDWHDAATKIERMRKVTRADIIRVAKQYLTGNFVAVRKVKGTITPAKITKPGITAVKLDASRQSPFAKEILAMPVTPIAPVTLHEGSDYARAKVATGELIAVKNPRNGLFSVSHIYNYGSADDRLACFALQTLRVSGAGKRDAAQVAHELHQLGVAVDTSCGKDESSITLSGIDRNLEAGMALLRDWLGESTIEDATLKARVATSLTERSNTVASPQAISAASAAYARYGDSTEYLVVPSNKMLSAATPKDLKKLLGGFLHRAHRTAYFGPRAAADAAAVVALGDGQIKQAAPRGAKFRRPNTTILADQQTAQTQIWMIWPRKVASNTDRAIGSLVGEYVAPLLYQEVREARGLAYTVFGAYSAGRKVDDSSFFAYIATQADKTHDALDAILATLGKPIDETRFKQAKETIAQEYRVDRVAPRAIARAVYGWQDQGEAGDPRAARNDRILALASGEVEKWLKAALAQPVILSVTGDRKKLDEKRLKKIAPVTVVPVAKLFGY